MRWLTMSWIVCTRNILQNLPARLIPVSPRDLIAIAMVQSHDPYLRSRVGELSYSIRLDGGSSSWQSCNFSDGNLSHRLTCSRHLSKPVYCDVVTQMHSEVLTRCSAVSGDGFAILS